MSGQERGHLDYPIPFLWENKIRIDSELQNPSTWGEKKNEERWRKGKGKGKKKNEKRGREKKKKAKGKKRKMVEKKGKKEKKEGKR